MLLAAALILAGCTDAPTSSGPAVANGPDVQMVPTDTPDECPGGTTGTSGTLPGSGALYLICVPAGFDPATGSLVVYAHGSVPPQQPLALPEDDVAGVPVAQIVTDQLGYAYATTSYRENGLVVVDAEKDLARLVAKFRELYGPIGGNTYAVGVSEGGLIVTLATERNSQLVDGTLSLCGPIGDFQREINYFDDFRLAFDFYFPASLIGIDLGSPIAISAEVIAAFNTPAFRSAIAAALLNPANWERTNALLASAGIPLSLPGSDTNVVVETVLRLLAYNILFTNDAQQTLGGQPYDNVANTDYPRQINGLDVPEFQADQPALSHLQAMYQTSGRLKSPLVTLYNRFDPIVPSWHETLYRQKVQAAGASEFLVAQIPSENPFGHCNFSLNDVLGAFGALTQAVGGAAVAAR
jgi:pimeloyl-ACP methyl ester carboxylesterase